MKFITDISQLEGKTIAKATFVDCDESAALIFTDGTCAFFDVRHYGDSYDLQLSPDMEDYLKRDAGIISEKEYERLREVESNARKAAQEKRERGMLATLKAKYNP